jgi:hypothetical protein
MAERIQNKEFSPRSDRMQKMMPSLYLQPFFRSLSTRIKDKKVKYLTFLKSSLILVFTYIRVQY